MLILYLFSSIPEEIVFFFIFSDLYNPTEIIQADAGPHPTWAAVQPSVSATVAPHRCRRSSGAVSGPPAGSPQPRSLRPPAKKRSNLKFHVKSFSLFFLQIHFQTSTCNQGAVVSDPFRFFADNLKHLNGRSVKGHAPKIQISGNNIQQTCINNII